MALGILAYLPAIIRISLGRYIIGEIEVLNTDRGTTVRGNWETSVCYYTNNCGHINLVYWRM